jgi:hypothetical protein
MIDMNCAFMLIGTVVMVAAVGGTSRKPEPKPERALSSNWRPLFHGWDLSGWERWLGGTGAGIFYHNIMILPELAK